MQDFEMDEYMQNLSHNNARHSLANVLERAERSLAHADEEHDKVHPIELNRFDLLPWQIRKRIYKLIALDSGDVSFQATQWRIRADNTRVYGWNAVSKKPSSLMVANKQISREFRSLLADTRWVHINGQANVYQRWIKERAFLYQREFQYKETIPNSIKRSITRLSLTISPDQEWGSRTWHHHAFQILDTFEQVQRQLTHLKINLREHASEPMPHSFFYNKNPVFFSNLSPALRYILGACRVLRADEMGGLQELEISMCWHQPEAKHFAMTAIILQEYFGHVWSVRWNKEPLPESDLQVCRFTLAAVTMELESERMQAELVRQTLQHGRRKWLFRGQFKLCCASAQEALSLNVDPSLDMDSIPSDLWEISK